MLIRWTRIRIRIRIRNTAWRPVIYLYNVLAGEARGWERVGDDVLVPGALFFIYVTWLQMNLEVNGDVEMICAFLAHVRYFTYATCIQVKREVGGMLR
jgi:hypothetical protein